MANDTIAVLGATGYTGGLIARELHRRGVAFIAAGRNRDKLAALAAALGQVETAEADVHRRASLDALLRRCRVVVNTAGPFVDLGPPVVEAAIGAGVHYLDTTGEQPFIKAMWRHDTAARQAHVAVVPAQAFEVAVSDCAAALAAEGFRDISAVEVTYATAFHASQGTQRTVLRMLQSTGYAYDCGDWIEEPPARYVRTITLPPPVGTVKTVSFPSAEVMTIPRHLQVREVRVFMSLPPLATRLLPATMPLLRAALRSPLGRAAQRYVGDGTAGPDANTRQQDTFHVAVDVRGVRDGRAGRRRALVSGVDPYGVTAAVAAQAAQWMAAPAYDRAGVLAPAAAFDPRQTLDALRTLGLSYELSNL